MDSSELQKKLEALEKENRILKKKHEIIRRNMVELEDTLETHSNALKVRNQELEESREKLRISESRYRKLALHDALTGLPNRAYFDLVLDRILDSARESGENVALLFLDLNRFKEVNDQFGHRTGDAVLIETARRLLMSIRLDDIVTRLGGDEFAVILPDVKLPAVAENVARRIVELLLAPFNVEEITCQIGVSIGISMFPADADNSEKLLQLADTAMYKIKRSSDFHYQFYKTW